MANVLKLQLTSLLGNSPENAKSVFIYIVVKFSNIFPFSCLVYTNRIQPKVFSKRAWWRANTKHVTRKAGGFIGIYFWPQRYQRVIPWIIPNWLMRTLSLASKRVACNDETRILKCGFYINGQLKSATLTRLLITLSRLAFSLLYWER